jgi:hypothetical protein
MAEGWSVLDDERVLNGCEVSALLSARVDQGRLTTYLHSDTGRLLTFVSNGTRAMVDHLVHHATALNSFIAPHTWSGMSGHWQRRSVQGRQCGGDHCCGLVRSLVREEEHFARDRHQGHVVGRLEGGSLGVGESAVTALFGVDYPRVTARRCEFGGEVPVLGDVVEVRGAYPDRVAAGLVLLEVLDQLALVRLGDPPT